MLGYKYPEKYGEPQVLLQDGLELNFVDVGRTGAPGQQTVVMLHGMTQSSSNWGPRDSNLVDPLLKLGFRVICPDNRGHGLSDKPSNEESYIPCADGEDVIKVLDSLGIDKAHLVGHSFGSTVTYKLLVTHPNRILSAVTASQPMGYVAPEEVAALVKGVEGKFLCARTCWYPCCFFGCWYCVAGEFCYPHGPHLLIKSHLLANVNPALDEYKAVSVPVQGIIGDKDELITIMKGTMKGVIPDYSMVVIPGQDHLGVLKDPMFRSTVLDFLKRQQGRVLQQELGNTAPGQQ